MKFTFFTKHNFYHCVCVFVTQLCLTLCTLWTVAHQAPLSMEFSRQEYWSELPFPFPGDLPNPEIEPGFPELRQVIYHLSHQGSSIVYSFLLLSSTALYEYPRISPAEGHLGCLLFPFCYYK